MLVEFIHPPPVKLPLRRPEMSIKLVVLRWKRIIPNLHISRSIPRVAGHMSRPSGCLDIVDVECVRDTGTPQIPNIAADIAVNQQPPQPMEMGRQLGLANTSTPRRFFIS